MAKKNHRKLFPSLASETNKTLDCSLGICDPICPYNCYQEPDHYTISPQLAPWSSPSPSPCPSIFAVYQQSQKSSSSLDAITIVIVTGSVIAILLTGFFLAAKYFAESENRVNQESYQSDDNDTVQEEEEFQDREQVDHPIWLIRTTGLNQSIINSITICNYKRGDGLIERTDCPVCLNEFEEDESLRLLPKCNHAFHISCIDTWLKSHTNCPLCRAGITISVVTTPRCSGPVDVIITPGGGSGSGSGSGLENDGVCEDGQIENRVESEVKERDDSDNTDPSSDVRIEIYEFGNEINRDLEEIDGGGSETETKDKVTIFEECVDPNGEDSIDSILLTKTHIGNGDFPGKSCENQTQELTRPIGGDEASCSEENGGHNNVQSRRRIDSGELNGEVTGDPGTVQSGISSNTLKTTGSSSVSSLLNKSKSSIFPL